MTTPLIPPPLTFPPRSGDALVLPWRVIDGDTLEMCLLLRETFRLYGINTPETRGPERERALRAAARIRELVGTAPITATLHGLDKFGRRLVTLYSPDGTNINGQLILEGLAAPYDGRGPRP